MSAPTGSALSPGYRYRAPRAAIAFLERAFGIVPHLVVPGDDDAVEHAELRIGDEYLMLGTLRDGAPTTTFATYIAVADVDAQHARAVAAGAVVVRPIETTAYGSREFAVLDPEGYPWSFGSYRPTAADEHASARPKLYVALRYDDARGAIAFLCDAFGFTEHVAYANDADRTDIAHAQLALGSTLVMLGGTRRDDPYVTTPTAVSTPATQGLNLFVPDPDAHAAVAIRGGAAIVTALHDTSYGARAYVARDPGGYAWHVSSYRPSAALRALD